MSAPKFTPGPWWFGISGESKGPAVPFDYVGPGYYDNPAIFGADGREVVGCDEYYVFSTPANARLIASAPELYEALQIAAHWLENHQSPAAMTAHLTAVAALAKARGEA